MSNPRYHAHFPERLKRFDFETLEKSEDSIYAINSNFEFIYFNPQYVKFAEQNGFKGSILEKHPIGSSIHQVLKGVSVSKFYMSNYLKSYEDGKAWTHEYQCSSSTVYRMYQMRTYPIPSEDCLIIIHSLSREMPIHEVYASGSRESDAKFIQPDGHLNQCSNCRRTRQSEDTDKWEWIPEYVDYPEPDKVTYTFCPICFDYYMKFAPRKIDRGGNYIV